MLINPVKCWACGRNWMLGEAMTLKLGRAVCPHTKDCNEQKHRARLIRDHRLTPATAKGES